MHGHLNVKFDNDDIGTRNGKEMFQTYKMLLPLVSFIITQCNY